MSPSTLYDVIIIGGSYAGLSAALSLGRLSKKIMVIDSEKPCNHMVSKSYNFLTQNGVSPQQILNIARQQVAAYPTVTLRSDEVTALAGVNGDFTVTTFSGLHFSSKKILFATGVRDLLPPIKGYSACWGLSVVHCPYCHGYEFRGKAAAVIAQGKAVLPMLQLLAPLHPQLTFISQEEEEESWHSPHTVIIRKKVAAIEHQHGQLHALIFEDGSHLKVDVLYIDPNFEQHSSLPAKIGCKMTDKNLIYINNEHQTSISGIYACGDCTSLMRSIASAVASGNLAGAIINKVLSEAP